MSENKQIVISERALTTMVLAGFMASDYEIGGPLEIQDKVVEKSFVITGGKISFSIDLSGDDIARGLTEIVRCEEVTSLNGWWHLHPFSGSPFLSSIDVENIANRFAHGARKFTEIVISPPMYIGAWELEPLDEDTISYEAMFVRFFLLKHNLRMYEEVINAERHSFYPTAYQGAFFPTGHNTPNRQAPGKNKRHRLWTPRQHGVTVTREVWDSIPWDMGRPRGVARKHITEYVQTFVARPEEDGSFVQFDE